MTETVRASADPGPGATPTDAPFSSRVRLDVAALTHPGRVRTNNEDQFFVTKLSRSLETLLTSLPEGAVPARSDEVNYVLVVADGMGGHAAGEVASRMVISTLVHLALEVPDWHLRMDAAHSPEIERRARQAVQQVGAEVVERGQQDEQLRGMGSTLTAVRSFGRDLMVIHVGDSRAYLFRGGTLHRLTRDHTYVQLLVDTGQLSAGEAATSRMRNVLTNVLGGSDERVQVDVDLLRLEDGDQLMLCSDGLTDHVDDDAITKTLAKSEPPARACDSLLQQALDGGGRDNVTVVVAKYSLPEEAVPPAR